MNRVMIDLKAQRAFDAARLRRLVNLVGLKDAVPAEDADLLDALGTTLGMVCREIEKLQDALAAK